MTAHVGDAVPGSTVIDIALGLIFVYLIFSVAVSRLNEVVTSWFQLRHRGLVRGIRGLLEGNADTPSPVAAGTPLNTEEVLKHPTVAALSGVIERRRKASYLPSRTFAAAVVDLLAPPTDAQLDNIDRAELPEPARPLFDAVTANPTSDTVDELLAQVPESNSQHEAIKDLAAMVGRDPLERAREKLSALPADHPAKRPLLRMLSDAAGNRDRFYEAIEHWYDDAMTRMGGWYARKIRVFLLAFGAALTIAFNVDTINIAQVLWRAPYERAAVAAVATNTAGMSITDMSSSVRDVAALNLPLGWTAPHVDGEQPGTRITSTDPRRLPSTAGAILLKILGFALTTIALSFGATFWFDVLGKVARLRNTGDRPPTTAAPAASTAPPAKP